MRCNVDNSVDDDDNDDDNDDNDIKVMGNNSYINKHTGRQLLKQTDTQLPK